MREDVGNWLKKRGFYLIGPGDGRFAPSSWPFSPYLSLALVVFVLPQPRSGRKITPFGRNFAHLRVEKAHSTHLTKANAQDENKIMAQNQEKIWQKRKIGRKIVYQSYICLYFIFYLFFVVSVYFSIIK